MALYNADLNVSGTLTVPSGIFSDSVTVSGASVLTADSVVGGGGSALTVKEVDGDPSVANVDTIVVSNDTLTDDGGGQVTISIGAGGGSGGLGQVSVTGTVWNPFLAPASGTIYDDEFIEGTVISGSEAWGGWDVWDPGSTALNIETFSQGGGLRLRKTSTSDDIEFMGIYKPIPTESLWEAVTFVHFGAPGSLSGPDTMYVGFAFFDDVAGNPATTDFVFQGIVMDSTGYTMTRALFSDYDDNTPASTSIDTDGGNISPNGVFLRATARDGNNNAFDLAYSYDGFGWKSFSFYTFPFTVNEIGLVCSNALTTSLMNFGARFFRIDPNFGGIGRRGFPLLGNYMDPTGGGGSSFDPSSDQTITGEWDFTNSLTVSGVPVNIGAGGGSGNITDINAQTGPSVTITGTGSIQTITEGNVVTISGLSQVGNSRYDAHIPPASGTQYDDEFDLPVGSSPNSDVWTTFDPGSDLNTMQIEQDPSRLFISTSNNGEFVGITRTDIDDSFSWSAFTYVRPHFRSSRTAAFDNFHGIVLVEDINSPSTTNLLLCGVFIEKASAGNNVIVAGRVGVWEFDQFDDATATLQDADSSYTDNSTGGVFIKVSYNASLNRVGCFWSNDGVAWQMTALPDLDSTTSMTGFNAIGIMSRTDGETSNSASFGFFRTDDPTSGESTTSPMPAGLLAGAIEDPNFTEMTSVSGTFTESLTVSGVPVNIGAGGGGASTLQEAYDGGDGTISTTGGKPLELTGTGELVAVTGTFTGGLTIGTGSTVINDHEITTATGSFTDFLTVSGVPVALGDPIEALVGKQTFRGARVSLVSNQTITTATNTQVLFDTTEFDTDGFVVGGDESEFIIPAGVSKVRLRAMCFWVSITSGDARQLSIRTGGFPGTNAGTTDQRREAAATGAQVFTYTQDVTPGQDFNVLVSHTRGTDLDLNGASVVNWFEIEVIEDEQDWLVDEFTAASGTFTQSLTISGVPVQTADVETFELRSKNFSGAVAHRASAASGTITLQDADPGSTRVDWGTITVDTDNFVNLGTADTDSIFTIPAGLGIKKVQVEANFTYTLLSPTTDGLFTAEIQKNGMSTEARSFFRNNEVDQAFNYNPAFHMTTAIEEVVDGDTFQFVVRSETAGVDAAVADNNRTWFSIKVLERDAPFTMGEFTAASGTFTQSLTVSGVPVATGTGGGGGASTLQEAYDNGDGTISITDGKPFELTSSGGLVAVTGTFTEGLTVGTGSTVIADGSITTATGTFDSVTVSGVPVLIGPVDTLLSKNFSGAVVSKEGGGNQAISGSTLSEWPVEILDTDGFFDSGTNTRFTIPSGKGIKKIRLTVCVQILADTTPSTTTYASIFIPKNGIDMVPSISWRFPHVFVAGLNVVNPSVTYPIDVEDGDYFELFVSSNAPGSPTIWNIRSYWAIEVVERDTPFELGEVVAVSGTFSESLTISGVPVATGTVGGGGSALTIRTPDSAPSVSNVSEIVVASGSLYDDGAGQVTIGPLPHLFAMKQLSGSTFAISTGFNIVVAWDLVQEDTDGREGLSGLVTGADGFIIPEHLTNSWWVAKAQIGWEAISDTNARTLTIFGPPNHRPRHSFTNDNNGNAAFQSVVSAPFMAPAGTHIRVALTHNTGTDKFIQADGPGGGAISWFSLERVGVSGTI